LLLLAELVGVATAPPPNVVLLMGDDHGWEETGYHGHLHVRTPVLDEMAASGLRFERFHAAHPSCSPTRASFLTGRHPNRMGTFAPGWSLRPEEVTMAHVLGRAGYRCGHFGKWHVGPVQAASPVSPGGMGFHEWLSHDNFFELNPSLSRNGGLPEVLPGESSEVIIRETIGFIERARQTGAPFLAVVWFGSPHEPYSGLPEDLARYDDLPAKYPDRKVRLTSNETGEPVLRPLGDVLRERYAEITAMDRTTAFRATTSDLLPTLAALVGQTLPDRPLDGMDLTSVLDGIGPEERPGPIHFWDFDTSRLREARPEPYLDPALQRGTTPLAKKSGGKFTRDFTNYRHPAVTDADFGGPRAILDGVHKLVIHPTRNGAPKRELFDLAADPGESVNVLDRSPDLARRLEDDLRKWQASVLRSLGGADYSR